MLHPSLGGGTKTKGSIRWRTFPQLTWAKQHRIASFSQQKVASPLQNETVNDQTTSQNKRVLSFKKNCLKLKNLCFCLENKTCTIVFPDIPPWGKVFYVFWGVQILPHLFGVYGSPGKEFAINSPNSKAAFLWIVSQCWDTIDSNPDFFQRRCQCHGNLPLLNSCFWVPW